MISNKLLQVPTWRYDTNTSKWATITPAQTNAYPTKPLHIITWNSMIDYYLAYPSVHSHVRWQYQLKYLEQLQPDIVALNEVAPELLTLIMKSSYVQNNFFISEVPAKYADFSTGESINPFGNLLLSKFVPYNAFQYHYECYNRRCAVIMTFVMKENNKQFVFGVTSIHLAAKTNKVHIRKAQLLELYSVIYKELCLSPLPLHQMFIMGDFNFHDEKENVLISNAYEDVWTTLNGNNEGFTFDSLKNKMVQQVYWGFEKRRMRLDRLLVSKMEQTHFKEKLAEYLKPVSIEMIGSEPIAATDNSQPDYLFPSDHFGLSLKCTLQNT